MDPNVEREIMDADGLAESPFVDVYALFAHYNRTLFDSKLDAVVLEWSSRMTLCAGTCRYQARERLVSIRLSEPLLRYRPTSDLINTLLHEMIHAYLFVTGDFKHDHDDHGPLFCSMMDNINRVEGTSITVFHTFSDEVDYYRVHWWKCTYCDLTIRRAMNRAPAPRDPWWGQHQSRCGGSFIKIKEPDPSEVKSRRCSRTSKPSRKRRASEKEIDPSSSGVSSSASNESRLPQPKPNSLLDQWLLRDSNSTSSSSVASEPLPTLIDLTSDARPSSVHSSVHFETLPSAFVKCPVCASFVEYEWIDPHLDTCLPCG